MWRVGMGELDVTRFVFYLESADAMGEYPPCEPPKAVLINVTFGD